jgi:hypothetical protein
MLDDLAAAQPHDADELPLDGLPDGGRPDGWPLCLPREVLCVATDRMVPPKGRLALANLPSVIFSAMITTAEEPGSSRCSTRLRNSASMPDSFTWTMASPRHGQPSDREAREGGFE